MARKQGVRRTSRDRTHHYIDVENLAGSGRLRPQDVIDVRDRFQQAVAPDEMDLFTVGCDSSNAFHVRSAFPGARLVVGHGPDGADLALIEAMQEDMQSGAWSKQVLLGSGDHIFAPILASMAGKGATTRVVGIEGHTSLRLKLAAHDTTLLPELEALPRKWSA
ncbi:UNVERIFIED_ORG: hypothetical protein J2X79_003722 [Arthrobacter globiformis]|nr:hypothetical protein [Arthrobacter globiformis]